MKRLVRLIGRKLSGSLVVSSTVMSSIFFADASVGMRDAVTPTWLASNCGASCFSTFSTFHTTASALNGEPSWKVTPGRSLKIHLVLSASSTFHSVARPGITTLGLVGRGQVPAGQRVVHGEAGEAVALKTLIGLAQRARNIGSGHADAQHGFGTGHARPRSRAAERQHRDQRRAGSSFLISIASILFRLSMTNFDANVCNGYANGETFSANCPCDDKSL